MTMLTWVWPPLALALSVWTYVRLRRDLTGPGRWLPADDAAPVDAMSATPRAGLNARDTDGWTEAQEHMAELSSDAVNREAAASHAGVVEDRAEPQRPCRPSPPSSGRSAPGRPSRRAEPAPTRWNPAIRPVRPTQCSGTVET